MLGLPRWLRHGGVLVVATAVGVGAAGAPARADLPRSWLADATSAAVPALRRGVTVVGVGLAPADATWPVASAVYADATLRPRLEDRDARVLAGAGPEPGAPPTTTDLAALRAQLAGDDVGSRALLAEVARRTGARAIVLVAAPGNEGGLVSARIWDAADDRLDATLFRAPWTTLVDTLRARYAAAPPPSASASHAPDLSPRPTDERGAASEGSGTFSSVWFWSALGGAAVLGALVYVATRDQNQPSPAPVRIEWGK
ncbi:MAG: hypothetical protein NVSMB47_13660 [Polyangiales bacterium]